VAKLDTHIKLTADTSELTQALEDDNIEGKVHEFRLKIRQIVHEEIEAALKELPHRIRASQGVQQ